MESIYLRRGFTLIELLVVLAIIMIVTTVVITSQSTFNKTLVLANTAYDVALTIRSTQTYGLSSRAFGIIANTGYGLHFERGVSESFILFADISPSAECDKPDCKRGDYVYTPSADERVQMYTLGNSMIVSDFCAYSSPNWICNSSGLSSLDIVFSRPNPDPFIRKNGQISQEASAACLTIASPQGGEKYISVAISGQINANASSCP